MSDNKLREIFDEVMSDKERFERLYKDAMRYRWLRDNGYLNKWWSIVGPNSRCENIDNDIDEAMQEEI